ncbi:MAG: spermidine/putrescine ABC transporter substrate-binding protein [Lachnospiraceae bacterium]|nr:spermidine/putrescine ABC transporter substrate-binding protein [Lachnospiraceae bacterium]
MKKAVIMLLAGALCTAGLSGCGKKSNQETLYVYNWSEYMPQEVYDLFEEETGIRVVEKTFSSNEEMLAKLVAGGASQYDLIVASNYVLNAMKDQNLIQPIDVSRLENFEQISAFAKGRAFDPDNEYSVPYMSTITVIAYNEELCEQLGVEIQRLDDLLDPALENNIVAVDDCREIVDIALKAKGEDPDSTDEAVISGTIDWLSKLAPNIRLYDSDTAFSALATNEVAVGIVYNMDAAQAIQENEDINVWYTEEPCELSIDNFVLSSTSQHMDAAYQFIDFIHRPEIYKLCLDEFPAVCLNDGARELLDEEYFGNAGANIKEEALEQAHIIDDVGDAAEYYDAVFARMKN